MLTAYSRVTVVTAERTIDLALPNALPLADVVPQVLRFAAPQSTDAPTRWTLARMGGAALALSQTLADAGVLDGDVLELREQGADVRPVVVEDVRDAVEDSVDAAGGVWRTRTTASFLVLSTSISLVVVAVVCWLLATFTDRFAPAAHDVIDVVPALVVAVALAFLAWWASVFARGVDAQVSAAVAMLWAALAGQAIAGDLGSGPADRADVVLVAAVALAVVAGAMRLVTPACTGHAAFAAVMVLAGLAETVTAAADVDQADLFRVLPVLAVLAVGVLPRVSLSVGGLASADYRVRHVGMLDLASLRSRYRASNAILIGGLAGMCLVVVVSGVALDVSGHPWDRTLAITVAAAAALRSRLFSRTQHMTSLRAAGLLVALVALVHLVVDTSGMLEWFAVMVVAVGVAAAGLTSTPMSEITRARVKRALNVVEFLVIVVLVVVMCGALGIYQRIGGIF